MMKPMLAVLDYFFLVFHSLFTLFNLTGWIWNRTRIIHLATIAATAFSWFIMGIWYGWGYCFCTDWHWKVRDALGNPIMSSSYIQFLIQEITGLSLPSQLVDNVTTGVFVFCCIMSVSLNVKDYRRYRAARKGPAS